MCKIDFNVIGPSILLAATGADQTEADAPCCLSVYVISGLRERGMEGRIEEGSENCATAADDSVIVLASFILSMMQPHQIGGA